MPASGSDAALGVCDAGRSRAGGERDCQEDAVSDVALAAMTAIKQIIDAESELAQVLKQVSVGVKDLSDYRNRLPAVGVAYTRVSVDEDGRETVEGFCEVVAVGERQAASAQSREIGGALYDLFKNYGDIGPGIRRFRA
jgi:hypothetical protein